MAAANTNYKGRPDEGGRPGIGMSDSRPRLIACQTEKSGNTFSGTDQAEALTRTSKPLADSGRAHPANGKWAYVGTHEWLTREWLTRGNDG